MIELTLEIPWSNIRSHTERTIRTLEGPEIDVLSLKKAELNLKLSEIVISGTKIRFEEKLLRSSWDEILSKGSVIYFFGVNNGGADGFVKEVRHGSDVALAYFFDSAHVENLQGAIRKGLIQIPLFGYEYEDLFNMLEKSGVIRRVSVYSFLVLNKNVFYKLIKEERPTIDEITALIPKLLKKK